MEKEFKLDWVFQSMALALVLGLVFGALIGLRWVYALITGDRPESYWVWGAYPVVTIIAVMALATVISNIRELTAKRGRLWDVATGKPARELAGVGKSIGSLSFSSDGRLLAGGSADWAIRMWEVATGKRQWKVESEDGPVRSIAFAPDDNTLAAGCYEKTICFLDKVTGKLLFKLEGHEYEVDSLAMAFSPGGKLLASGGFDSNDLPIILLWEVSSRKVIRRLGGLEYGYGINSVAFSPDGKLLASGSVDQTVRFWEVATGKQVRAMAGHTQSVTCVTFSPEGKTLASGSNDKSVRLWEVNTGRQLHKLEGCGGVVTSVAFSPDGRILASGAA
jgi:WD40 repeat protein